MLTGHNIFQHDSINVERMLRQMLWPFDRGFRSNKQNTKNTSCWQNKNDGKKHNKKFRQRAIDEQTPVQNFHQVKLKKHRLRSNRQNLKKYQPLFVTRDSQSKNSIFIPFPQSLTWRRPADRGDCWLWVRDWPQNKVVGRQHNQQIPPKWHERIKSDK